MPTTSKALFRGAASLTSATLYTTPSQTTTVVTSIIVANTSASAGTFTLSMGNVVIAPTIAVGGNDSTVIDLKQVLTATQTITGTASATTINFHISGVEIA